MAEVSLIIAVHKRHNFLEKVLISLGNQRLKDFEVVIAEDGIDDGVADIVARYQTFFMHPIVHIRQEHDGFRKTLIANKAVNLSGAQYLVFIDGDCIVHQRFLESHVRHRRLGTVLSGRRVMLKQEITAAITLDDVRSKKIENILFWLNQCDRDSIKQGFYIPFSCAIENLFKPQYRILGSNFSVYKQDYLNVNGYDERIVGRGMEDSNLCARFKLSGMRIRTIAREAIQYHLFHAYDPIPHDPNTIQRFCFPKEYWTEFGLIKGEKTSKQIRTAPFANT
jgi:Glycosyltransferases, probably involved in cell wall biogenesis